MEAVTWVSDAGRIPQHCALEQRRLAPSALHDSDPTPGPQVTAPDWEAPDRRPPLRRLRDPRRGATNRMPGPQATPWQDGCPNYVADRVLVLRPGVRPEPLWWESQDQDTEPPETTETHVISIGESSPSDLHLNAKTAPPNSHQAPVLDAPCQTTSKTGTQPHTLTETQLKIILSSQTSRNTTLDAALPTRKTRSSPTHQNTSTSALHQETYTSHWTNLTHWEQTPKTMGTMNLQPEKMRPQTQ